MLLIDSHAHLDDEKFDEDREEVISSLKNNGVEFVINPASDLESSKNAVRLANKYENIYACIGNHPHEAKLYNDEVEDEYIELSKNKKVVAIGEIGLDYHYDNSPRDIQRDVFIRQIELAKKLNLPIVIHSRDAVGDTLEILEEYGKDMKVMIHAYSESVEVLRNYLKLGFYISIGGVVTFKNARKVKESVIELPLDRLLIETDSPYLTPEPYRGKRNEPKYTKYVAMKLSELMEINVEKIIEASNMNAKKFFGIGNEN